MKTATTWAWTVALACAAAAARAQAPGPPVEALSIEELLDAEVETPALRRMRMASAPSTVSVLQREDIRRFGFLTVAEAVNSVVGMDVLHGFTVKQIPTARGILQSLYANKVLLMLNGIPTWQSITADGILNRVAIDLPGAEALPFGDVAALEAALAAGDVAAVVVEPIQLEGGVRPLPPGYVEALAALTARHGTLLVADEIQTGLGRTGRFLASAAWPRRPDAVVVGKHLGGGLLPLSALLTDGARFQRAYGGGGFERAEAHNCTFSASAPVCVAGLAALDLLDDALLARVAAVGRRFRARLGEALAVLPLYREARGDGLIVGVALEPIRHPWLSFEHFGLPELGHRPVVGLLLCHRLYRRGFYGFVCGHDWSVLRLLPRYEIPEPVLDDLTAALREELESLGRLA